MKLVLRLHAGGHLSDTQLAVAYALWRSGQPSRLPGVLNRFLLGALADDAEAQLIESRFCLPSRSAKAILGLLLDAAREAGLPEPPAGPIDDVADAARALTVGAAGALAARYRLNTNQATIVALFGARSGRTVTYERLIRCLWPDGNEPEVVMESLRTQILRLRRILAPEGLRIVAIQGIGYRLDGPRSAIAQLAAHCPPPPAATGEVRDYLAGDDAMLEPIADLMSAHGLSPSEARVLLRLIEARGRTVALRQFLSVLPGNSERRTASEIVRLHVMRLRRKCAHLTIETVKGVGYRLAGLK